MQMNSVQDKPKNLSDADQLARQAIDRDGSKLVVFPEHFDWAGGTTEGKLAAGEAERDAPAYEMCRRLALDCNVHVHSGSSYEISPTGDRD